MEKDNSVIDAAPQGIKDAYLSGKRVYLVTRYSEKSAHHRTGTIGKTTGWKPAYLVMHRANQLGSWDMLSSFDYENGAGRTEVLGVQGSDGRYRNPRTGELVKPGRNRFEG